VTAVLDEAWNDLHRGTPYPFADESHLQSIGQAVTIPQGAFVDAAVATSVLNTACHLSSISRPAATPDQLQVVFSQGNQAVAQVTLNPLSDGWVALTTPAGLTAGQIKVSQSGIAPMFGWQLQTFRFQPAAATLVPYVTYHRPLDGVQGLRLVDETIPVDDDGVVHVIAGRGLRFVQPAPGDPIRLDVVGDPYAGRDAEEKVLRPIYRINGTAPDEGGSVEPVDPAEGLIAGAVIRSPDRPALRISNPAPNIIRLEFDG